MFARPLRERSWFSVRFLFPNKLRRFGMVSSAHVYAAILGLTLMFLISSGVGLGQEGNAGHSNPAYSGASGAVNPNTIDDATLKQTAKAYVKVRQIVQNAEIALNNTTDNMNGRSHRRASNGATARPRGSVTCRQVASRAAP